MGTPELKHIHDLRQEDFDRFPVWRNVRDEFDQSWHDGTDEATYRPWTAPLPFECMKPDAPKVLVRAEFRLADGTQLFGKLLPPIASMTKPQTMNRLQPTIFTPQSTLFRTYFGGQSPRAIWKEKQYAHIGRAANEVFPIAFAVVPGLIDINVRGTIDGFHWMDTSTTPWTLRSER